MVSPPTLSLEISEIFNIFLFLLTFSYHWKSLYEPHCWQCSDHPSLSGYSAANTLEVMKENIAMSFLPHKLPILTSQFHLP